MNNQCMTLPLSHERNPRQYVNEWVMAVSKTERVDYNLLLPDVAMVGTLAFTLKTKGAIRGSRPDG